MIYKFGILLFLLSTFTSDIPFLTKTLTTQKDIGCILVCGEVEFVGNSIVRPVSQEECAVRGQCHLVPCPVTQVRKKCFQL